MQEQKNNFFDLSSNELLSLNLLLTIILANGLNSNQLNILGNFICALGQNILTIQAVIGSLPDSNATYMILGDAHCLASTDTNTNHEATVIGLANEISELKEKITQLEIFLSLKKD